MRAQRAIPAIAKTMLKAIPEEFVDDGCTNAPDTIFGFDLKWACRIHDWCGCSRCHPAGSLTLRAMRDANSAFRGFIAEALPWRWRWLNWVYYLAVKRFNGDVAWDSCGPESGERCRHNMPMPAWMKRNS